jgi:hypothetical protein
MSPSDYMRSPFFYRNGWTPVANYSGVEIPPFSVVYNHLSSGGFGILGFQVKQPNVSSTEFDREYFVTGPYAIAAAEGAEGIATTLRSPGFVRIDDADGSSAIKNTVWGPKNGQFTLSEHYYGFLCYGGFVEDVCGNTVAPFTQIGYTGLCGTVDDTDVAKGASATISVYTDNFGSDTGMNVSATNHAIDLESVNGKKCIIYAPGAYAFFIMLECPS